MARNITSDNTLWANKGMSPVPGFNFMLRVEVAFDLPCKSVHAFSRELEYELIQEGGLNDYVHMRRKPISKPFYLEVERYVGVDYVDPLPLGAELMLPVVLMVNRNPDQFVPFFSARTYVFTGCTVVKKSYGELVGDQSGLLVDTTTIAYREMICMDAPWSEAALDSETTDFDSEASKAALTELNKTVADAEAARKKEEKARAVKDFTETADLAEAAEEAEKAREAEAQARKVTDYTDTSDLEKAAKAAADAEAKAAAERDKTAGEQQAARDKAAAERAEAAKKQQEADKKQLDALNEAAAKAAAAREAEEEARAVQDYTTTDDLRKTAEQAAAARAKEEAARKGASADKAETPENTAETSEAASPENAD